MTNGLMVRNTVISVAVGAVLGSFYTFAVPGNSLGWTSGFGIAIFVWFLLFSISKNRSVATVDNEERHRLLLEGPPAGCGLVYVYREGFVGKAAGFDVSLDGVTVAQLKSPRFTRLVVAGGNHVVSSGLRIGAGFESKEVPLGFTLMAGETIVLTLKQKMGLVQGSVVVMQEPDQAAAFKKLHGIPMVAADGAVGGQAGGPVRSQG